LLRKKGLEKSSLAADAARELFLFKPKDWNEALAEEDIVLFFGTETLLYRLLNCIP